MRTISPKHIVAHSQCPTKAFLMFKSEVPLEPTEYDKLVLKFQAKAFAKYCDNLTEIQDYQDGNALDCWQKPVRFWHRLGLKVGAGAQLLFCAAR